MDEFASRFVQFWAAEQTQFVGSWLIVLLSLGFALRIGLPQGSKASDALKEAAQIKQRDRRISRFDIKLKRIGGHVTLGVIFRCRFTGQSLQETRGGSEPIQAG